MSKKVIFGGILIVFILVTISMSSAVNVNEKSYNENVSPLFNIRANKETKESSADIETDFLGKERIFLIPLLPKSTDPDSSGLITKSCFTHFFGTFLCTNCGIMCNGPKDVQFDKHPDSIRICPSD